MASKKRAGAECRECMRHNGLSSFARKAALPECDAKLEAEFVDAFSRFARLKPAAADMFPRFELEDRPILDHVFLVIIDLPLQALAHLSGREWAAGQPRSFWVSPQLEGQWQVSLRPNAESESR